LIKFKEIQGSRRTPGVPSEINTELAVRGLPANKQKQLNLGQRLKAHIEPARFQGGTLNDATSQGTYTGTTTKKFMVKISTAAATDKFQYSIDNGANWSAETDITGSAQTLEDGVTVTFGATTGHAADDEWHFSAWPEPTVAELTPTQAFSDTEAAEQFGYGSIAHLMAKAAFAANRYLDLSTCAQDDAAGNAAAGDGTVAGTATKSGSAKIDIGYTRIEAAYVKDDPPADIALALQAEMEKYPGLPVFFAVDGSTPGKINFTAKHKGELGNDIPISAEVTPQSGVTLTITDMTGGTTDPDVASALAVVEGTRYHLIATSLNDETSLGKLVTHLNLVSDATNKLGSRGVFATTGAYASATTLSAAINAGRLIPEWLRYTSATKRQSISYEIAAGFAAIDAFEEDPAMPLDDRVINGIAPPAVEDRLSPTEIENCLWNGVSPLVVGPTGKVQVVMAITTYTKNAQGVDDPALLEFNVFKVADYLRDAVVDDATKYKAAVGKIAAKTPDRMRSRLINVLRKLEDLEIIEKVEDYLDGVIVERDDSNPGRINEQIPADIVNGLHLVAQRLDIYL
jgi:phage tail sheath gpL-like